MVGSLLDIFIGECRKIEDEQQRRSYIVFFLMYVVIHAITYLYKIIIVYNYMITDISPKIMPKNLQFSEL